MTWDSPPGWIAMLVLGSVALSAISRAVGWNARRGWERAGDPGARPQVADFTDSARAQPTWHERDDEELKVP